LHHAEEAEEADEADDAAMLEALSIM